MANSLRLGDGTTEINFLSGTTTQWRVSSWTPAVATRRRGDLGGRGPYNDVVEEMVVSVKSTAPLTAVATLEHIMDRAQRWGRGELVDPVYLYYQPTSGSEELKAVVLGADGDAPVVDLPPGYVLSAATGMIDGIVLRFRRQGLWLGGEATATSDPAANPETQTMGAFTAPGVDSPFELEILDITHNLSDLFNSFILVSSGVGATAAAKRICVVDSEDLDDTSFTAEVADTDNKARSGNVLRYTADGIYPDSFADSGFVNVSSVTDNSARRWGLFFNYRNNSATTTFYVSADIYQGTAADATVRMPTYVIPAGISDPAWGYIGAVTLTARLFGFELLCASDIADSSTFDIDSFVLIALDNPATDRVIAILETTPNSLSAASDLKIEHRLLDSMTPFVWVEEAGSSILALNYQGDAALFMDAKATHISACWLATKGEYWRSTNSGGTVYDLAFKATMRPGYLIPQ